MIGTQFPNAIWSGKIGRAIVKHHGCPEQQCSENFPRSHHPAHVRHPEKSFVGVKIETVPHVLDGFDGEAAMRVHRALGSTGRARGVNDHHRVFCGCAFARLSVRRSCRSPHRQSSFGSAARDGDSYNFRDPFAGLFKHDQMLQTRNLRRRFIGNRFHCAKFPPPVSSIGSEERFCLGIF